MSGLAGKVRRATESDEFDLANYDQARCDELAKAAFSEPLPLKEMVRLSFVVGGGKLVRQKYSDDLPKIFMGAMSAVGYEDDNAAAVEVGSAGKFKFQHDTGKNLKFVHVFPRIGGAAAGPAAAQDEEEEEEEGDPRAESPEVLMMRCAKDAFTSFLQEQLATYGQKKRLLDMLKARIANLEEIEGKMTRVEKLTAEEQALFDDVGVEEVREKARIVSADLQSMAEAGQLTSAEKAGLLEQLDSRLSAAEAEIAKAEAEGKPKRVQQLQQQVEALRKTQAAAKGASPVSLPPLRHAAEIQKLHRKLAELNKIEKEKKGNYSVDELKKLSERADMEEAIGVLKERSRGWFEADEVFQDRLQACLRAAASAAPKKGASSGGGASAARPSSSSSGGFTLVGGGGGAKAKAKASAPNTRNAWSALG